MYIQCYILYSKINNYLPSKYYNLKLINKIGEGNYGIVYELNKNYVVKIFKNSFANSNINNESNSLIPLKNENREINFFIQYLNNKQNTNNSFFIDVKAIGVIIKDCDLYNIKVNKDSFFMIMPSCISIYNLLNLWKKPLINEKNGIELILNIMKRMIYIQLYLYNEYKLFNLDIKLDNFMIDRKKKLSIDNIINIDLGLIKTKTSETYSFNYNYNIWPKGDNLNLDKIPSYSLCINCLEILLGKKILNNMNNIYIREQLNILKNNVEVFNIFYNGLLLKLNLKQLLKLILSYLENNNK